MAQTETGLYVIQHGIHRPRNLMENPAEWPVNIGIGPELPTDTAERLFCYLQRHLHDHHLARRCDLIQDIPSGSEPHTLIHIHGLQAHKEAIMELAQARLLSALGHTAFIDHEDYDLWPRIGIGLFFWKTLAEY